MKLSNLAGILLLLFGVGAGVFLVQQVQDYRERAAKPTKQTICHKTGSADNPYVTIEVDEHALKAHIDHGDTLGACPETDGGTGGDSGDTSSDNSGDDGGTSVGSSTGGGSGGDDGGDDTETRVVTETKYVYLNPGTLQFYVKFYGVDEKREDKSIRVEMRKEDEEVHIYEDVVVSADNNGVYSGTIREVPPGSYDIFIKNINHLQRKFSDVSLVRGFNRWYWNENELLPGDFDTDNDVDINDIALFLSNYDQEEIQVDTENINYDVNFDEVINQEDLELILEIYTSLTVKGEN